MEDLNHTLQEGEAKVFGTDIAEMLPAGALVLQRRRMEQSIRQHGPLSGDLNRTYKELDLAKKWQELKNISLNLQKHVQEDTLFIRTRNESFQRYFAEEKIREAQMRARNAIDEANNNIAEINLHKAQRSLVNRQQILQVSHESAAINKRKWDEVKSIKAKILSFRENLGKLVDYMTQEILFRAHHEQKEAELVKELDVKKKELALGKNPTTSKYTEQQLEAMIAEHQKAQLESKKRYLAELKQQALFEAHIDAQSQRLLKLGEKDAVPLVLERSPQEVQDELMGLSQQSKGLVDHVVDTNKLLPDISQKVASLDESRREDSLDSSEDIIDDPFKTS